MHQRPQKHPLGLAGPVHNSDKAKRKEKSSDHYSHLRGQNLGGGGRGGLAMQPFAEVKQSLYTQTTGVGGARETDRRGLCTKDFTRSNFFQVSLAELYQPPASNAGQMRKFSLEAPSCYCNANKLPSIIIQVKGG